MPQKVLKFTSINRKVNEYQNSGACEELINLRPAINGGCSIVRRKVGKYTNVDYDMYYEHSFGETTNIIVVIKGIVKWKANENDTDTITTAFAGKDVSICSAGNVILLYNEESKIQEAYKFEDEKYSVFGFSINPIIDAKIKYTYSSTLTPANRVVSDDENEGAYNEALAKAVSGFHTKYPNGLAGVSIVGCTYELEDGSEIWSTAFLVANPTKLLFYRMPLVDEADDKAVTVYGASKAFLELEFAGTKSENVKSVNIYATRPVFPYEIRFTSFDGGQKYMYHPVSLSELNLDGQLMYFVGSVAPNEKSTSFTMRFGDIAGNNIMNVDNGCIERTGKAVSYNNRFHFYRSKVDHVLQIPTSSQEYVQQISGADTSFSYWAAYIYINNKWKAINKIYKFRDGKGHYSEDEVNKVHDIVYPMLGVNEVRFVKGALDKDGVFSTPYEEMFCVKLRDSSAYNYSYAFDVTPEIESASNFYNELQKENQLWGTFDEKVLIRTDVNAINVTTPFNPYVFPVEYSYGFGGEIIDIATSYLPISSTQAGQYPITVFTSNGIYTLEQGDGNALYSNVVPLQPQVIVGKARATPYGTFFVSSNNLYVLSGRETANVSSLLNGSRELKIRDTKAYKMLCCTENGTLYNFTKYLSGENFEDFIDDVVFTYDQLNNELYISSGNPDVGYSYVFNLDTKAYHKISKRYLESYNGARYAIEVNGDTRSVVDLHKEVDIDTQHILLQSRPFGLDVLYTHIKRLQMFADAKLEGKNQNLCLSVFGSDNLYDWKCIISAQKHDTVLRQITTNRAAKSYKDYVILINGTVSTDTDLSEIIADYTVVSRRIG